MQRHIVRRVVSGGEKLPSNLHPVLRRVYAARGATSPEAIDYGLAGLHSYHTLLGIEKAVALLWTAIECSQRVLVVADFDADGATACAVAVRGLKALGATQVKYLVPNRFEYGYGLTPEIVSLAMQYRPELLITVDNGISSHAGAAAAQAAGTRLLITDHHLPGASIPIADAIVNPNQPGDPFPSKHLAGVGVMFYVLMALRARLREEGWFRRRGRTEPNLADLLGLVALGTVADVVPLDRNNRILVAQGLARIRAGRCVAGIQALLALSGRNLSQVSAEDLAFSVGPRLNAAGRLADMRLGIECLLADEPVLAKRLAGRLDALNRERRIIQSKMQDEALKALERLAMDGQEATPVGVCLYDESWHPGVVGILAGRLRDRLHRPVIAFALGSGDEIKGSARSLTGVHIRDVLEGVAARHPGLITRFGGHATAAGLVLKREHLATFTEVFDWEVRRWVSEETLRGTLYSDGALTAAELGIDLATTLADAGPWGQGFPAPLFDGDFELAEQRVVSGRHLKLLLRPQGGGQCVDGMVFNATERGWPQELRHARLAYRLTVNEYQGSRGPQLVVEHAIAPR